MLRVDVDTETPMNALMPDDMAILMSVFRQGDTATLMNVFKPDVTETAVSVVAVVTVSLSKSSSAWKCFAGAYP